MTGLTASLTTGPAATGASRIAAERVAFAAEIRDHLTRHPRELPTRHLYDELGSALFEAICRLPWYPLTRAEHRLLCSSREEVMRLLGRIDTVVELGPGSGAKLRTLLSVPALQGQRLDVHLIDLSRSALHAAGRVLGELPDVRVTEHEAEYQTGMREAARAARPSGRTLAVFLGSNIGNFGPEESRALLGDLRCTLRPGDALLLGTDLVKPARDLVLAYDDPLGVTAAFNLNLLVRLNRELGADFDLSGWAHRALWNAAASRVEMHLVARRPQRVRIPAAELEIDFADGETIWTESSYKYEPAGIDALLEPGGFRALRRWIDRADRFALTLAEAG
jgi:dimethylhistidine N-methyltransferase